MKFKFSISVIIFWCLLHLNKQKDQPVYKNCASCTANGFSWCKKKCIDKVDACPLELRQTIDECTESNGKLTNPQVCSRMHIATSLNTK